MTIGLTWRRTARRIKRLKEGVLTIFPDYSDRRTPDFLALSLDKPELTLEWDKIQHRERQATIPNIEQRRSITRALSAPSRFPALLLRAPPRVSVRIKPI
jgi:hypothetical protein